jgi:hypothetical protein
VKVTFQVFLDLVQRVISIVFYSSQAVNKAHTPYPGHRLIFLILLRVYPEGSLPNVRCILLDFKLSPCSPNGSGYFSNQTFCRITPQYFSNLVHSTHTYLPMKMEQTECSETSAYKIQTPRNYPEGIIQVAFCYEKPYFMWCRFLINLFLSEHHSIVFSFTHCMKCHRFKFSRRPLLYAEEHRTDFLRNPAAGSEI